jgi:glycosyltransferase involved in cell wall biosynthesis
MHIVVNGWFWGQLSTGSGQYLHHLARCLPQVAAGDTFTLVLPASVAVEPSILPPSWRLQRAATPLDRLHGDLAKVWFEQVSFPQACRHLGADVAFVPYWGSPWWRPCRTVVTVHDLIPLLLPEYGGGRPQRLYTALVSRTARRAHRVITDSRASREDIIGHLGIPPGRVHAVLLAAADLFRPVTDPAELQRVRSKYGLPERFILYLGGFDARKNVTNLVSAYADWLRQHDRPSSPSTVPSGTVSRLVIAGKLPGTDTPFTPDPRRLVAAQDIADWVHFTGWVDEVDKPALYSLADLFAFPSLYEGFGLPAAEAAACGTPVLTSNRSSLPEAAPRALLVDPEDVDAMAHALDSALRLERQVPARGLRNWRDVAWEVHGLLTAAVDRVG